MGVNSDERREQVLAAIVSAGTRGVSGQAIADELRCSRAAVHRHVEALRREGVAVEGVHEGYVLGPGADPVVPLLVTPRLLPPIAGPVRWAARTGSTNDDAVEAARRGAPEGTVIGADFQERGRGRRGRPWISAPHDALTFSVVLRPPVAPVDAAMLPLVAALAVAQVLGPEARIAWPNDILTGDRKVCGILCESSADESGLAWAVVGIGVNVRSAPDVADARWRAGHLTGPAGRAARGDLLVAILTALAKRYREWLEAGAGPAVQAFAERDWLAGTGVTVRVGDHDVTGTAQGIDELGRLRVLGPAGERALGAGEVVRVERDGA